MNFKQFYLGCLAHASYYIGSENEAAIIVAEPAASSGRRRSFGVRLRAA